MQLTKKLKDAGYDLIESPVRNHKTLQLWRKRMLDEVEFFYSSIHHAFRSSVNLVEEIDPALNVTSDTKNDYSFNIGVTFLEETLKSLGLGSFELSSKIKSGRKVTISYDNSQTRIVPIGVIQNFLTSADFEHPNPSLLKHLNRDNVLIISGTVYAQNLVVEIETDFDLSGELVASLNQAADGKLGFNISSSNKLKMVSSGQAFFPIAVKADRICFRKGKFVDTQLITDTRDFF